MRLVSWSFIFLVVALVSLACLNPSKLGLSAFCKYDLKMNPDQGEPWNSYASHYDFRDIPPVVDIIKVSYDWEESFCSPTNVIPIRIQLKNTIAGQGLQFGVDIRVEAPTGIIVGNLPNGTYVVKLDMYKSYDATVKYTPPEEWQGYVLHIHAVVWIDSPSKVTYYRPFDAWTMPPLRGNESVQDAIQLGFYVITVAPLLPPIASRVASERVKKRFEEQ